MKKAFVLLAATAILASVGTAQTGTTDTSHHSKTMHKSMHHSTSHLRGLDSARKTGKMPNKPMAQ